MICSNRLTKTVSFYFQAGIAALLISNYELLIINFSIAFKPPALSIQHPQYYYVKHRLQISLRYLLLSTLIRPAMP